MQIAGKGPEAQWLSETFQGLFATPSRRLQWVTICF
jgi:hypothetical protein